MRNYRRGSVHELNSIGTLAAGTLLSQDMDETVTERTLVSSIVANWSLSAWTPVSGAGPLMVGVAHSDYTDTQIEEYIEATTSWAAVNLPTREISQRKIRRIGIFNVSLDALTIEVLNDGKPIKTKLNWVLGSGDTLSVWAYNTGAVAVSGATNPALRAQGHANLFIL